MRKLFFHCDYDMKVVRFLTVLSVNLANTQGLQYVK